MWLIVLDRSGSMADPFTGLGPADVKGSTRLTAEPSKWAAATRVLRNEVASLADGERICVIVFNEAAETVFDGIPAQAEALEAALAGITPGGGTELADALGAALTVAAASGDAQVSVVVISDGLADEKESSRAAAALAARVGMIEVMLIDPTHEGQAVAKAVAVRGRVTSIVSADELQLIGQETSKRHVEETSRVQRALARADEERQAVASKVPAKERLSFTVGYPSRPLADTWTPLSVYLHLSRDDLEQEVRRRLAALAQQVGLPVADSRTSAFLNRGAWLKITPRVEGVQFNPPCQVVAWFEDLQEVAFRFRVPQALASRSLLGFIEVTGESGIWLADLAVNLRALAPGEPLPAGDPPAELDTCRLPEQIFASYAHADREVVEACAAVYKALGVHLNIDRNDLTVAREWHPGLLQLIDRSDVFQLYWSDTSKASPHVCREWGHALAQRGRKGARFVRGVYWREPMPAPPEPLAGLHFGYLDLSALAGPEPSPVAPITSHAAPVAPPASTDETEIQAAPATLVLQRAAAVQATVLPLLPGLTRHGLAALRKQAQLAAAFLESVTGLRYQPVPTLVVDKHLVHEVREVLRMVDAPPALDVTKVAEAAHARAEMEACRDVLRAQLLEFHCRKVPPLVSDPVNDEERQIPGVSDAALHGVRDFGEWGVSRWTRDYLNEPWIEPDRMRASPGTAQEEPPRRSLGEITLDALAVLIDRASALASGPRQADREIKTDFSPFGSSSSPAFDDRTALDTVLGLHTLRGVDVKTKEVVWSSSKPWWPKSDWRYEVSGKVSAFVQILVLCRERLAELLPKLEGWSYTAPEQKEEASQAIGYAVVASKLGEELMSGSDRTSQDQARRLGGNVVDALYPSWRRARDYLVTQGMAEMVGLGFKGFLRAYLARMLLIFKFGLDTSTGFLHEGGYPITQAGRDMARSLLPDLEFRAAQRWRNDDEDKYLLTVPFQDFVALFERASLRFLQALENLPGRDDAPKPTAVATRVIIETSTFGIFAPEGATNVDNSLAQWMVSRQAMPQISLPGMPRVLYCLHALQEAAAKRRGEDESPPSATLLSLALLVHEHFHALAETAPGTDGLPPRGPGGREDWAQATPLNEALAAWMEAHAMRELAPMLGTAADAETAQQAVWRYIRSGAYPAWPYRGAERVQAIHESEGIAGVRRLVNALRQDPAEAQRAFDQTA